jgi:enoyl-CoA hydratase/carnithine racemase
MAAERIARKMDGSFMIPTLDRPDKLDACTGTTGSKIEDAFRRADADDDMRAIIVACSHERRDVPAEAKRRAGNSGRNA